MQDPSEPLKVALGRLFRSRRAALGLSLEQVAQQVRDLGGSIDGSTVSRIEGGKVLPGLETVFHLSRALAVPLSRVEEELRVAAEAPASAAGDAAPDDLLERGRRHVVRGRYGLAVHVLRAAVDGAEREGADSSTLGDLRTWLAYALLSAGNARGADEILVEVVNDDTLPPDLLLRALMTRVQARSRLRDWVAAEGLASRVGRWYEQAGPRPRAYADTVLALLSFRRQRWEEAEKRYRAAERSWEELGVPLEVQRTRVARAACLLEQGAAREALELVEPALEKARGLDAQDVVAWGLRVRARARAATGGETEDIVRDLEEARRIAAELGLAREEFLAWHALWRWHREHGGPPGEQARAVRGMRRLLGEVDPELEEVRELVSTLAMDENPGGGEGRSR